MRRRTFIAGLGGTAAWPMIAHTATPASPVVGFISPRESNGDADLVAFRQGLNEAGYTDGTNVAIDVRALNGDARGLADDLINRQVSVIVATTPGAIAAKSRTSTIPIVFATGGDPVKLGLVASLNRPGGNVTGVTFLGPLMEAKRLELLHQAIPEAKSISVLLDPNGPLAETQVAEIENATAKLGLRLDLQKAASERDLAATFDAILHAHSGALLVSAGPVFFTHREQIIDQAASHKIPAMYGRREFAVSGGLMSYGTTLADLFRQVGVYTGQILKGAKPADLPVLETAKFEFLINLRTAKTLGLTIPPTLLARADEVIE